MISACALYARSHARSARTLLHYASTRFVIDRRQSRHSFVFLIAVELNHDHIHPQLQDSGPHPLNCFLAIQSSEPKKCEC